MDEAEILPCSPTGVLAPIPVLLSWLDGLRAHAITAVRLPAMPFGNGSLPTLLGLAGIETLILEQCPLSSPFFWEGLGGGRLLVRPAGSASPATPAAPPSEHPVHHGHLPVGTWRTGDPPTWSAAEIEIARAKAAQSLFGDRAGPTPGPDLAQQASVESMRPLTTMPAATGSSAIITDGNPPVPGLWNPLALGRRCVATWQAPDASPSPGCLIDGAGASHPVQRVHGHHGPEMLCQIPMAPLAAARLQHASRMSPGAHWEVGPRVLDNGRIRVELDDCGRIGRCCVDGAFIDLTGALACPRVEGVPIARAVTARILEQGPVRSQLAVDHQCREGGLHIVYAIHAHEGVVHVTATWDGPGNRNVVLGHPTAFRNAPLEVAGDLAPWSVAQSASVIALVGGQQPGCRWARLGDGGGERSLAAVGAGSLLNVSATGGDLRIQVSGTTTYALSPGVTGTGRVNLGQLALGLTAPAPPWGGPDHPPGALAWSDLGGLVPVWIRRPAGWSGEVVLSEQWGRRGRAFCTLKGAFREIVRADFTDRTWPLHRTAPAGDGVDIDYLPYELLLLRWR